MPFTSLPLLAGIASTVIFAGSTLPMLGKAWRTRDLRSYSLGNLVLANTGNLVHAVYVFSLPPGPIWLLHTFNLTTTALMLGWYVAYRDVRVPGSDEPELGGLHDDRPPVGQLELRQDRRDVVVGRLG